MASASPQREKLRVLPIPFFATSHIGPFADLAFHLAAARPGVVEATVAVTPANVPVVRSAIARRDHAAVEIATYAFPPMDGLPPGVENHSTARAADAWRIDAAAVDERLMRPGQESLIRDRSPDAVVSDVHFSWNADVAAGLGVPCVTFHAIGAFPMLAIFHLLGARVTEAGGSVVTLPGFPGPDIRVPVTELPEMLRSQRPDYRATGERDRYCDMYVRHGYVKRAYFVGPLSLPSPSQLAAGEDGSRFIDWLDRKPAQSLVYLCFGSLTHVSEPQLRELALGLEASGKPFLWVVRSEAWVPPEGWKERVGDRRMVVTGWAPQTAILAHPAVGAFVTHCGWNSVLETVVAGVPVLTWPMVFEQFITERFVTEVLAIGERLWPEGVGVRSTRSEEHELIPGEAVARAVARFMEPGGAGEAARSRVKGLSAKAHAAMAEGTMS
ncbi:UDP-glycosyltransferase 73E1-like [Panicum miliaceum]|uniref:Glycosyltransferase n=1 Tax=Panicum miliaceum TaxID=4540 RepID=A0A3L6RCI3_PANMI|nr:UDP-glycosyltransferase 73E1-like [Panicum miliaceum]